MVDARRRRLAWLFALALILELALLCCACAHLCDHCCPGCEDCAICRYVRLSRGPFTALVLGAFAALAAVTSSARGRCTSCRFALFTPVSRKVRLND